MTDKNKFESIPFRMHPRVFAALGADLVTNDVVAVIELVKNSYDALAHNVWIRFTTDSAGNPLLEIEDDGEGMTRDIIENVWCLVATPYKEQNPHIGRGKEKRRVAGEKGLGRLSVARLGENLRMITKAPDSHCYIVDVDWPEVSSGNDISKSYVRLSKFVGKPPFAKSGTILQISSLNSKWDESHISDLEENLARLISPFAKIDKFNIYLSKPGKTGMEELQIEVPHFLSKPKYAIMGKVDVEGNIKGKYRFAPIKEGAPRTKVFTYSWEQIYDFIQNQTRYAFNPKKAQCGPFAFEIRAWDIGPDDTQEIAERFDFQKTKIRKSIGVHKGISVYRDGILVLPKSDGARDWLGLDLRRVSKVGTRLSTSQIVGYVSISADSNPHIEDTSDRERLVSNIQVAEFEELLIYIIRVLENELNQDRLKRSKEKPLEDIFESLNAEETVAEVVALAEEGANASEAVPIIRAFGATLDTARKTIQERFVFYSRLATVGTIAQMLVHEIRNRTTAFGSFLKFIRDRFGPFREKTFEEEYKQADNSVDALESLAERFSPLASRNFRRKMRSSILEERIRECLSLQAGEINRKGIRCHYPKSETSVAVDPGELDAILLNLITNSVYWLGQVPVEKREIEFKLNFINDDKRVRVWVHDTGPGIPEEDIEKVFWPGVTRKPGGIGMGLTVASELVAEYGGKMLAKHPGAKAGASFAFDLPIKG